VEDTEELRLVSAALAGEPLAGGEVRAEVIRDVVVGRHGELDPRGLLIRGAVIMGQLDLDGVHCGVPVRLIECRFAEPVLARGAHLSLLSLAGSQLPGLRARGIHVSGWLNCGGARMTNETGAAVGIDNARIDGGVLLNDGFVAEGRGGHGVVRMVDAQVGSQVDLSDATLTNPTGPTLVANRMTVSGDLFMRGAFTASGSSRKSLVRLNSARLGGLEFSSTSRLENPDGPVLGLQNATVEWVRFPAGLLGGDRTVLLTGFTYTTLSKDGADWRRWLHWLRHHTLEYTAQPYQQLAAVQRAAGHDSAARSVLIAQQDDLRTRGDLGGRWARTRHRLWGALAGYGYRSGRAAAALVAVLLLAGAIGWVAGHTPTHDGRFAALRTSGAEQPFTPCSSLELIGLGIDRGLPLGATGIRDRCDLDTASQVGQVFTAGIWLLQAIVWALATLVIAGYTGLIRKIT
jgi:hypothetical protein